MLLLCSSTGMPAAGIWLTLIPQCFHHMTLLSGPIQCSSKQVDTCRCRAPSHMQIRHASCEHGNSCSHALQQQMRHATQPFSMHRSSRAALPRSAHSSMQVVCSASRLSAKLSSPEWRYHRGSQRRQRGRDAAGVAHAASSGRRSSMP